MITAFYRFENLPPELREANKINSKKRLDCTGHAGDYKGLINFVNNKGMLFFYLTTARDFVNAESKRIADVSLTNGSINLTSIYIEDVDFPHIGYGYPNAKRLLANGNENPMFQYRNDGYLFIMNTEYSRIDLFVVTDGRNLITAYYQKLIDGGFDDEISALRKQAKPFFDYNKAL